MEFDALFDDITALLQNGFAGASDFFDQDRGQYDFKDPSPNEPPRGVDLAACIPLANWSCPAYVPVSELIYAAFRSKAKGLFPPSDEWRRRGL